jgi:outer membrane usher protein
MAELTPNSAGTSLGFAHQSDPDGGFGYGTAISFGRNTSLDGHAVWYRDELSANGSIAGTRGAAAAQIGIDGSLILTGGKLYASRQDDGAFALVKTGKPGVRVTLENRTVATSDADGEALVPGLVAFAPNRIGVDTRDYPLSSVIEQSERVVVAPRAGTIGIDLAPPIKAPLLVTIRLSDGTDPPAGSHAILDPGGKDFVIGRHGKLFIDDLKAPAALIVELPNGRCRAAVIPPRQLPDRIARTGPVLCASIDHAA